MYVNLDVGMGMYVHIFIKESFGILRIFCTYQDLSAYIVGAFQYKIFIKILRIFDLFMFFVSS